MRRLYKAIKFYLAELVFKKHNQIESSEVIERLKECLECDFNNLGSCTSCGCVIKAKVYCPDCDCPEGYWKKSAPKGAPSLTKPYQKEIYVTNGRDTSK